MTAHYIQVIQQQLQNKNPQPQIQQSLTLQNIRFKLFLPKTTLLLTQYKQLKTLTITHCDLRNLENFPKLQRLQQLDLGHNQLQGTFNNLMPLKRLKYLNLENNIVFQLTKLAPLRKIAQTNQQKNTAKLSICVRNNPFVTQDTPYLAKLKSYGLKVVKQPKEYFDKKSQDNQKPIKTTKQQSGKKSKTKQSNQKSIKKTKKPWHQISPSNDDSSQLSSLSSIVGPIEANHRNNSIAQMVPRHQSQLMYQRIANPRHSLLDNMNDGMGGRMMVRMGSSSGQQGRVDVRNIGDNPFLNMEMIDANEMEEMGRFFQLQDDPSESDQQVGVFATGGSMYGGSGVGIGRSGEIQIEARMREYERRAARIQRQHRMQRQRIRLQRMQVQRQRRLVRHRQLHELNRTELDRLHMGQPENTIPPVRQLSFNRNNEFQDLSAWRDSVMRRPRNHHEIYMGNRTGATQANGIPSSGNSLHRPSMVRRPMGYREYMELAGGNNNNSDIYGTGNGSTSLADSTLPALRIRPSTDSTSNIIRLMRATSPAYLFESPQQNPRESFIDRDDSEIDPYLNDDMDDDEEEDQNIDDDDDDDNENENDDDDGEEEMNPCQVGRLMRMEQEENSDDDDGDVLLGNGQAPQFLLDNDDEDDEDHQIAMLFNGRQDERQNLNMPNPHDSSDRLDFQLIQQASDEFQLISNIQPNPSRQVDPNSEGEQPHDDNTSSAEQI